MCWFIRFIFYNPARETSAHSAFLKTCKRQIKLTTKKHNGNVSETSI